MSGLDLLLGLSRGLDLIAALSLFGTLVFRLTVLRPDEASARVLRPLHRLSRASFAGCLAGAVAWLPSEAASMLGGLSWNDAGGQLWLVASQTQFGLVLLGRTALSGTAVLLAGDLASRHRVGLATVAAAAALALQAQLGHAAAADEASMPFTTALHVLAAGAWLGSLLPLAITIRSLPGPSLGRFLRRYSGLGGGAVLLLAGSAVAQASALVGDLGGWLGTLYGRLALGKIAGLLALLAIAALNRFVLTPRAESAGEAAIPRHRHALGISIGVEIMVGLLVVTLAVWLAMTPPAVHDTPVWPFAQRPDFKSLSDPYIASQVRCGLVLLGVGLAGAAALLGRRTRILGPLLAIVAILALPWPNLRLLARPAYPTSYQHSGTGYTVSSISRGLDLVRHYCTADCFRAKDDPSDLTPYAIWQRPDGDFFWWLGAVLDRIGHSPFPYGTIATLDAHRRWQLIDYFRARAAGTAVADAGAWPFPVPAPGLHLSCGNKAVDLGALHGRLVHLAFRRTGSAAKLPPLPAGLAADTVLVTDGTGTIEHASSGCVADQPDAWTAYAITLGLGEDQIDGADLLIDANGWLRLRRLPDGRIAAVPSDAEPGLESWSEGATTIARHPFAASDIGAHRH